MPSQYPFYNEPSHDQGTASTHGRDTTVSVAEGRMIVDAVDRYFVDWQEQKFGETGKLLFYKGQSRTKHTAKGRLKV